MQLTEDEQKNVAALLGRSDSRDRQQIAMALAMQDLDQWRAKRVRVSLGRDDGTEAALLIVTTEPESIRRLNETLAELDAEDDELDADDALEADADAVAEALGDDDESGVANG